MREIILFLQSYIEKLRMFLGRIPTKGDKNFRLRIRLIKSTERYYLQNVKTKEEKYLSKAKHDLVVKYAKQEYWEELRKACLSTISKLEKCLCILCACKDPIELFDNLPKSRKELIGKRPSIVNVQAWLKDKAIFIPKPFGKNDPVIEAINGMRVRSKSEAMIVRVFVELGIPFVYEYPVYVDDLDIYPDFHVLNTRTGEEFVYEHFGGMDNEDYVNNQFLWKIEQYKKIGLTLGKNFVATFETKYRPLNEKELREFVKEHFL